MDNEHFSYRKLLSLFKIIRREFNQAVYRFYIDSVDIGKFYLKAGQRGNAGKWRQLISCEMNVLTAYYQVS